MVLCPRPWSVPNNVIFLYPWSAMWRPGFVYGLVPFAKGSVFLFLTKLGLSILASIRTGIYLIAQDSFHTRHTSTTQEVERQDIGRRNFEQHWLISLWKVHPTIYSGSDPTESSPSRCPERTTTFRDRVMRMRRRRPPDHLGSLPTSLYQVLLSYSCVSSV